MHPEEKTVIDSQKKRLYQLIGEKIGRYITEIRELKQTEFAKRIGMNRATLSNIIAGRQQVSIHLLMNIAEELKVEPSTFLPTIEELNETLRDSKIQYNKILSEKGISKSSQNTILNIINQKNEK